MDGARAAGSVVAAVRFDNAGLAVHVARPHPIGERVVGPILVAALGRHIEIPVGAEELLASAPERRIGMEDLAGVISDEHAVAGAVLQPRD